LQIRHSGACCASAVSGGLLIATGSGDAAEALFEIAVPQEDAANVRRANMLNKIDALISLLPKSSGRSFFGGRWSMCSL